MEPVTVFISYAREDREAARRLFKDLKSYNVIPWLDEESLLPGQRWKEEIRKAIKRSSYFIALLSTNSLSKRGHVQKEFRDALDILDEIPESDIYVIPIRLEECEPTHEKLQELHRVDMFPSWRDGLHRVLKAIGLEPRQEYVERGLFHTGFRIGTFNLCNFDDRLGSNPSFSDRIAVMRPQLFRLNADILCLQEVHGQVKDGHGPRQLFALDELINGTPYADYKKVCTLTTREEPYSVRNLVILSRFDIVEHMQIKHQYIKPPGYETMYGIPPDLAAKNVNWERPLQLVKVELRENDYLYVINAHLKSRRPTRVEGQKIGLDSWQSTIGWSEGCFISMVKQSGQALELRALIDSIFDDDNQAQIVVCGTLSTDIGEVPMEMILGQAHNTGNGSLADRELVVAQSAISEFSRFSMLHRGKGIMIDHILMSRALLSRYRFSEIHNEYITDQTIDIEMQGRPDSDHAPVAAEFQLK